MILSARYGFVGLDQRIKSYEQHMRRSGAIADAELVRQAAAMPAPARVVTIGGDAYRRAVRRCWPQATSPFDPPIGGMGAQIAWLTRNHGRID